jgi:hypothetical protein
VRSTNLKGWLGSFPEPVWYDPKAVANILSLYTVKKYYRVKYNSQKDDAFIVSDADGQDYRFVPTGRGLYAYHRQSDDDWAFVSTVADKKDLYTNQAYQAAARARQVQNIIMFPGMREFQMITANNLLPNCPVRRADIIAAEDIFGSNIGALKGKTVHRSGKHVDGRVDDVPTEILKLYGNVVLSIDIMFINKVPFFITKSRNLHFATVESLTNRQITNVLAALKRVVQLYKRRGFHIQTIQADPEFEPLIKKLPNIEFNLCAQDEHVPDIERYIRTVKDRVRSCYNILPYPCIPRLMLVRLVCNAVFWLNTFPHQDGVSSNLSPRYILTGKHLDYHKHVRIEFGAYVQTHEDHTNGMEARTTGSICLGPSGNDQGGHYFLSLTSGRRLHRHRWTSLPLPNDARHRIGQLGRAQNMPSNLTFADRFGHRIPDTLADIDERSTDTSSNDSDFQPGSNYDSDHDSYSEYDSDTDTDDDNDDDDHGNADNVVPPTYISSPNTITGMHIMSAPMPTDQPADDASHTHSVDQHNESDPESSDDHVPTTGVDRTTITGVDATEMIDNTGDAATDANDPMTNNYGPRNHNFNLRPRKPRSYDYRYSHQMHVT